MAAMNPTAYLGTMPDPDNDELDQVQLSQN